MEQASSNARQPKASTAPRSQTQDASQLLARLLQAHSPKACHSDHISTACHEATDAQSLYTTHPQPACGVEFAPTGQWECQGKRHIPLPDGRTLEIAHDERGGPVALDEKKQWDDSVLVSLTDEGDCAACAWASIDADSPIVGLGIDLASKPDFAGSRGERFVPLLFSARERVLVPQLFPDDLALGYAFAFSAKEAAFKSCAASLRRWYQTHDEELSFDVRCFELVDRTQEDGTARTGEARRAMDLLDIERIELTRMALGSTAFTIALALAGSVTCPSLQADGCSKRPSDHRRSHLQPNQ